MKRLLLSALLPVLALSARAQFQYTFTSQTGQTYTPLPATATALNGSQPWDEEGFQFPLPFTVKFNGTQNLTNLSVLAAPFPSCADDTNLLSPRSGFMALTADLYDKGYSDTTTPSLTSESPIRYQTTGTAPNRIVKVEFRNAAFYAEYDSLGTVNDSVSFQYWFYETSNIVELRYGPSHVTAGFPYFYFGNGPSVGFYENIDFYSGALDHAYFLTGNPAAPTLDSTTAINNVGALNTYPASGTVYRFTPKPGTGVGVGAARALAGVSVYPTAASTSVSVSNPTGQPLLYSLLTPTGSVLAADQPLAPGTRQIDVAALPAGTYFVRVIGEGTHATFRFSKL